MAEEMEDEGRPMSPEMKVLLGIPFYPSSFERWFQWQPIETLEAGLDVLLYCPEDDHHMFVGYLCAFERVFKSCPAQKAVPFVPTHWLNLPVTP